MPSTFDTDARASSRSQPEQVEFVELCRPRSIPIAMLIKQVLEQHSVIALVKGGHSVSILPHLAVFGELRILVDRKQLDSAREIYRAYFESDDEDFVSEE